MSDPVSAAERARTVEGDRDHLTPGAPEEAADPDSGSAGAGGGRPHWHDLPQGFQVQLDLSSVIGRDRRHLLGGSPMSMLTLSERAVSMFDDDGRLVVCDEASATIARRLLTTQLGRPRPMFGPDADSVSVVVPVRDNQQGIDRLLASLRGVARVIVVDDGSAEPVRVPPQAVSAQCPPVEVIRFQTSRGPAAARNAGAAATTSEFVAFLDSDVVPEHDWLAKMLAHFSDERVALVAPRIRPMSVDGGPTLRYEALKSSLDMGRVEAAVVPGTPVAYVPSAAMIVRHSVFDELGGFDEDMHVAEDVDLCWRLHGVGAVMRYEPVATVTHDHRGRLASAFGRRRFYGTGAAVLAGRHDRTGAPLVLNSALAVLLAGLFSGTRAGLAAAVFAAVFILRQLRTRITDLPHSARVAAALTARSVGFGVLQMASALCRSYWPLSLLLALLSKRFRLILAAAALCDGIVEWVRIEILDPDPVPRLGPVLFVAYKRMDDLAYGAGLWQGAIAHRSATALAPVLRTRAEARDTATQRPVGRPRRS